MTPICFLDTETDGVHPGRKVWEVAMIRRDDTGERETQFYVALDLSSADPFGLKVGGFYDRHPMGRYLSGRTDHAPTTGSEYLWPFSAAHEVARFTHGAHLVGAVPNFDAEVLANLLRAEGLTPAWHYHLIDVEAMAVGWLAGRGTGLSSPQDHVMQPPWKSDDLARACGVEPPSDDERHTALGDARWAMRLYDALIGGTPSPLPPTQTSPWCSPGCGTCTLQPRGSPTRSGPSACAANAYTNGPAAQHKSQDT